MKPKRAIYCFAVLAALILGVWLWARLGSFDAAGILGQSLFAIEIRNSQLHLLWLNAPEADLRNLPGENGKVLEYQWMQAQTVLRLRKPASSEYERWLVIKSIRADGKYLAGGPHLASTDHDFARSWPYGYVCFAKGNIENDTIPRNAHTRLTLFQLIFHPFHVLAFITFVYVGLYGRTVVRSIQHRRAFQVCRRCGYDLRASLEQGRCPECGRPIPDEQLTKIKNECTACPSK